MSKKVNILGIKDLSFNVSNDFDIQLIMKLFETDHLSCFVKCIEENKIDECPFTISRVIDKDVRYKILCEQKWKCNNCFVSLKFSKKSDWDAEVAEIDHIHPFADRKSYCNGEFNINERSNLQALCGKCNKIKSKRKN